MANKKIDLQAQVSQILEQAQEKGVRENFFFVTTFKRYQVQMSILSDLEKAINNLGTTVTKEYVKGRENICVNPAITEYNKTATAANGTVATLVKIVQSFANDAEEKDELLEFLKAN